MQFSKTTVLGFFDSSQKTYEIPVYQRAYSWEEKNWRVFLEDLMEQLNGDNDYFYGNILLETINPNRLYEIIDGQQRLTTLSIFLATLINELGEKGDIEGFNKEEKYKIFVKNNGNVKLRPVEYDRACYDTIIVDNCDSYETNTPSQKRILETKNYFKKELSKLDSNILLQILEKIENTELTYIELKNKKDAALMFELENNRGKELTNMEKIKSYFMYQMYTNSKEEETNNNIEYISNIFKEIYTLVNDIKLEEDSVLFYHNQAYLKGYSYRKIDEIKDEFKKATNKIDWIREYILELRASFFNIKKFENLDNANKQKLVDLGISAYVYPFILKAFKYKDDHKDLEIFLEALEILTFRARLINSRANIQERLNKILLNFNGDIENFIKELQKKLNEEWYWGDDNTSNYLNGNLYGNKVLNHILWRYENFLQKKGYVISKFKIENEQIEHISPKEPDNGKIVNGYDVKNGKYDEEFKQEYLNCIGNLMLISGSHNASIGNQPFEKKLASYNANPLLNQQAEIEDFAKKENGKNVWKKESIDERHLKIVNFAYNEWNFERLLKLF